MNLFKIEGTVGVNIWVLQAKGASIGDVYIATKFANHDRRIPIPVRKETELVDDIVLSIVALYTFVLEVINTRSSVYCC